MPTINKEIENDNEASLHNADLDNGNDGNIFTPTPTLLDKEDKILKFNHILNLKSIIL